MFRARVDHPELGPLVRRRGRWRGQLALPGAAVVPLSLPGDRRGPDDRAVNLVRDLPATLGAIDADLAAAFTDHRSTAGDDDGDPVPTHVAVISLDARLATEVGYTVPWDDEHTLGAWIVDRELVELNGSVLEP